MMKLAILLVVGVIARQAHGDEPEAIVGGNVASSGQFPYQISLQLVGEHICGGSIMDPTHILTAAHCVEDEWTHEYITVVTGATSSIGKDGEIHDVKCIRLHPEYTGKRSDGWKNDIAVITLDKPIEFDDLQRPIPLASRDYATGKLRGVISGWGQISAESDTSPILLWVTANVLSQEDCLAAHPKSRFGGAFTNPKHICTLEAVGKGACQGDSGGPLVVNNELCGVVSWVSPCARGYADVFTNVYYYLDFIKESLKMC